MAKISTAISELSFYMMNLFESETIIFAKHLHTCSLLVFFKDFACKQQRFPCKRWRV